MHRSCSHRAIVAMVAIASVLTAGAVLADETAPVRVDADRLAPALAGDGGPMLELTSPEPGPAERWRRGLADATERRDQDVAELQAQLATAAGDERARLERRLQARKLDFEIEVIELQLAFAAEQPAASAPETAETAEARAAAVTRLEASLEVARSLRDRVAGGEEAR